MRRLLIIAALLAALILAGGCLGEGSVRPQDQPFQARPYCVAQK